MLNIEIKDQSINELKKEVKELENVSIIAMERLESDLANFSSSIEVISVSHNRPLASDIKKLS